MSKTTSDRQPNRLIHETSPYLLQHAHNPVDWHPWGDEAFQQAANLNRPVLLSVGYSTCHWCHVMEHESFENEQVAKVLNEKFISCSTYLIIFSASYISSTATTSSSSSPRARIISILSPISARYKDTFSIFILPQFVAYRNVAGASSKANLLLNVTKSEIDGKADRIHGADRSTDLFRVAARHVGRPGIGVGRGLVHGGV